MNFRDKVRSRLRWPKVLSFCYYCSVFVSTLDNAWMIWINHKLIYPEGNEWRYFNLLMTTKGVDIYHVLEDTMEKKKQLSAD